MLTLNKLTLASLNLYFMPESKKEKKKRRPRKKKNQVVEKPAAPHTVYVMPNGTRSAIRSTMRPSQKVNLAVDVLKHHLGMTAGNPSITVAMKLSQLKDEEVASFKAFRREIARWAFGTQEPTIELHSDYKTMLTSGSVMTTGMSDPYGIGWPMVADRETWGNVFDECRILHGRVRYIAEQYIGSSTSWKVAKFIGVIDYDDSTTIGNSAQALSYDTHKIFYLEIPYDASGGHCNWEVKPQGIPDLSWITTANSSTYVAYWKVYPFSNSVTLGQNTVYGQVYQSLVVRFRQVDTP